MTTNRKGTLCAPLWRHCIGIRGSGWWGLMGAWHQGLRGDGMSHISLGAAVSRRAWLQLYRSLCNSSS